MKKMKSPFWIGPLLAAVACVVYLWTLSAGAFPGESAALVSRACGEQPVLSTANPLWRMAASALSAVPVGTVAFRLNLLSVLCGAGALWLMYHVMSNIVCLLMDPGIADDEHVSRAGALAGVSSALALGFSAPFWIASTRAHVAAFDLCLLLGLAALFVDYIRRDSPRSLMAFALLYGLGTVEFATCVIFAPFFASVLIFVLWTRNDLNGKMLLKISGLAALGLLLFPLAAWQFMGTEMQLLQDASYGEVLWSSIRGHYILLAYSLPAVGSLLVLLVTALPWITCVLTAKRALNADLEPGYMMLHLLMFFLTLLLFFNVKSVSPWNVETGRLLLTPYALAAMVYGYVAAYLYIHAKTAAANTKPIAALLESRAMQGIVLCVPVIITLVAGAMNYRVADGRPARALNEYASALVGRLGSRTWLVTDGMLDDVILLAAHEAGQSLTVINGRLGDNEFYMRYIATKFEDTRMKSLADVGMAPLLRAWISDDPSVTGRLAVALVPDVWLSGGMVAIPDGCVFLGARDFGGVDVPKTLERHEQFWAAQLPGLRASAEARNAVSGISKELLRHCSLVANNLGVMLADMGRTNDAYQAYARSRDILPENISALLNQLLLIQGGYAATNAAQVEKDFQLLAGTNAAAHSAWGLSRYFGYVRSPEAFMAMGMTWAASGNPALAVAGARRAVAMSGGRQAAAAKQGLANLYMTRNQDVESEALYRDILSKDSNNWAACVGLARVSVKKREFNEASKYLMRAEVLKAPKTAVEMERAALLYAQGELEKSRTILKKLVGANPKQTDAWLMLAGILIQEGSTGDALDDCLKHLAELKNDASVAMINGYAAQARKDLTLARREFERALALRPGSVIMLEVLLGMDFSEARKESAQRHVKQLLSIAPEHPYGNYILAKLQMDRKEYALAEDSLRRSLATSPTPVVMNDLAWVQVTRGAAAEGEKTVRQALELDPKADYAYDTLGVALMRLNRFSEAQQAFEKALLLNPSQTSAVLHLAELSVLKGERSKAAGYLDMLDARRKELSTEDMETIKELKKSLQAAL